ncbi:MAG: hypothetical protein HUJ68_02020 [Clostridia bacterium]|nr:hypothetical protein [Clostridia bacterium]
MKKLLLLILIVLFAALSIYVIMGGISIGNIHINGINGIREESDNLDKTIQKAAKLATTDFAKVQDDIKKDSKSLTDVKQQYEEKVALSNSSDVAVANQLENYQIDSLMVKLGNHATSKGATANIEISTAGGTDIYNLNITATGSYISITDFISAIENDSTLGFKIEDFKMNPSDSNILQASFKCNGITIKGISQQTNSSNIRNENNYANGNIDEMNNSNPSKNTTNTNTNSNTSVNTNTNRYQNNSTNTQSNR